MSKWRTRNLLVSKDLQSMVFTLPYIARKQLKTLNINLGLTGLIEFGKVQATKGEHTMTLQEIKQAVRNGITVHWSNDGYEVKKWSYKDSSDQWVILCTWNDNAIGLTHMDGITMNGKESEFYTE